MKKIIAMLAVLAILPTANAGDSDFSTNAEFRLRYTYLDNANFNSDVSDSTTGFVQRLKLGGTYRAGEKFSLTYSLIHNATWGAEGSLGFDGTYNDQLNPDPSGTGTPVASGYSTNNILHVNEAYASWMASDDMSFRAGRFGVEVADGTVVSKDDYAATPHSFEGMGMFYNTSFAHLAVFGAQLSEFSTASPTSNDPQRNAYILSSDFKSLPSFLKMANFHVVKLNSQALTGTAAEDSLAYGLTVGGASMGLDYTFTYAGQTGSHNVSGAEQDIKASMMNLGLGYAMNNLKFSFGYHMDTGDDAATADDESYNFFFYDNHKYAGAGDFIAWGNLTSMNVGVDWANDDLTAGFHYWTFSETEEVGSDSAIGTEMDIVVKKKYSDNFGIGTTLSLFTPSEEKSGSSNTDAEQKLVVNTTWNF